MDEFMEYVRRCALDGININGCLQPMTTALTGVEMLGVILHRDTQPNALDRAAAIVEAALLWRAVGADRIAHICDVAVVIRPIDKIEGPEPRDDPTATDAVLVLDAVATGVTSHLWPYTTSDDGQRAYLDDVEQIDNYHGPALDALNIILRKQPEEIEFFADIRQYATWLAKLGHTVVAAKAGWLHDWPHE